MSNLRSVKKDMAVQAVNADLVAGIQHIMGVLQQSIEAKKRGVLLSKRIEIDILLRLACTGQISKAVIDIGLKDGMNNVLVIAIGKINHLKEFRKYITANYGINNNILQKPSKKRMKIISSLHGIGKEELNALVSDGNRIASILIERASLL